MKKYTTLFCSLFLVYSLQAQISSGEITFTDGYSAIIDIDDTTVTVTLVGEEDRYLAIGFDTNGMDAGKDIISFDATGFNDRRFNGVAVPPPTDTQDWTIVSNDVDAGVRTLVVTRPLEGTDDTDFVFDPNATSLDLVWARGSSLNFQNHGTQNRGTTTINFTLGVDGVQTAQTVSLFPVPAKEFMTVSLQNIALDNAQLIVYSSLGQEVLRTIVDHKSMIVNTSELATGTYILKVESTSGVLTTRFIKR